MRNFLEYIFNREPEVNYVIAAYRPKKMDLLQIDINLTEYELYKMQESIDTQADEMQIDNIYQRV